MSRNDRPWRHLYSRAAWKRLRAAQLQRQPLCKMCERAGVITPAGVVDHVVAHKGNEALFFSPGNLQSLCKLHHDAAKQKAEKHGIAEIGCDESGIPLDSGHHWHN